MRSCTGNICFVISLVLLFYSCGSGKSERLEYHLQETPPFKIGASYYQEWISGTKAGNTGYYVYITLNQLTEEVKIRNIYFKNGVSEARPSDDNDSLYVGYFTSGPKADVIMDIEPEKEAQNVPPARSPFDLKEGQAVLSYEYQGSVSYTLIAGIQPKEPLAYPSAKPNGNN